MSVPFPSFRKVQEQAEDGVPAAKLLVAAIQLLSETEEHEDYVADEIYRIICEECELS